MSHAPSLSFWLRSSVDPPSVPPPQVPPSSKHGCAYYRNHVETSLDSPPSVYTPVHPPPSVGSCVPPDPDPQQCSPKIKMASTPAVGYLPPPIGTIIEIPLIFVRLLPHPILSIAASRQHSLFLRLHVLPTLRAYGARAPLPIMAPL